MLPDTLASWAELDPDHPYPMTADDLAALPHGSWTYELVHGRVVRIAPTSLEHSDIVWNIGIPLRTFVRARDLGLVTIPETGFKLNDPNEPDTVLGADIAFTRAEHVPAPGSADRRRFGQFAPDLVIEVVSPSQYHPEMAVKARVWLAAGVRLVWNVWPVQHQVDIWEIGSNEPIATLGLRATLDGGAVLPGFSLPVADVFA